VVVRSVEKILDARVQLQIAAIASLQGIRGTEIRLRESGILERTGSSRREEAPEDFAIGHEIHRDGCAPADPLAGNKSGRVPRYAEDAPESWHRDVTVRVDSRICVGAGERHAANRLRLDAQFHATRHPSGSVDVTGASS